MPRKRRNNEYVVEFIADSKLVEGKWFFLIKWKNYPCSQNTWEPEEHLEKCPQLISRYFSSKDGKAKKAEIEQNQVFEDEREVDEDSGKQFPKMSGDSKPYYAAVSDIQSENGVESSSTRSLDLLTASSNDPSRQFESLSSETEEGPHQNGLDSSSSSSVSDSSDESICFEKFGFEKGYEPERILGATNEFNGGVLMFLVKWRGVIEADLVSADEANEKCPQLVIDFYEDRLQFESNTNQPEIVISSQP